MCRVDRDVLLEALSVLTGVSVKTYSGVKGSWNVNVLNVHNLITATLSVSLGSHASVAGLLNSILQPGSPKELLVDFNEFLDPQYDYEFKRSRDNSTGRRGDDEYKRPYGWTRIALKVLNKYSNGNAWLGPNGWRNQAVPGEWPVSYQGSRIQSNDMEILATYDINQATGFSKRFTSQKNGKEYIVLIQNRINPAMVKKCPGSEYWLVDIPKCCSDSEKKMILEDSIRPYGILLKEI